MHCYVFDGIPQSREHPLTFGAGSELYAIVLSLCSLNLFVFINERCILL